MPSPQLISDDIFSTIRTTFEFIQKLQSVRPFSNEEQEVFTKIGTLMPVLFEKIIRYYEQDEQAHIKAFQLSFKYPQLFDQPQTLEIIISYMYGVLKSIQQKSFYVFFNDFNHAMYVEQLLNANQHKIQRMIASR